VVHKEQPVGIVFGFDRLQARIICSPERALPAALRFPRAPITSPRLRGEVGSRTRFPVRGDGARLRYRFAQPKRSPSPQPSPGKRGEGGRIERRSSRAMGEHIERLAQFVAQIHGRMFQHRCSSTQNWCCWIRWV
jgi:hypothetical protein